MSNKPEQMDETDIPETDFLVVCEASTTSVRSVKQVS